MKTGFTTQLLHLDRRKPVEHNAVHKPIHPAVAYGYPDAADLVRVFQGEMAGHTYGRQGNPTTSALEDKISLMEQGLATVSFTTGMAAIGAVFTVLLRAGDHLISSVFLFGNTNSMIETVRRLGVDVTFVDATDAAAVAAAVRPNTRMVFVETIANPRTQVADLTGIGELCARLNLLYVVDNTMTSPCLFVGKSAGAGLVVNSLTKYIGGHGNALGGAVTDTGLFDWSGYANIHDVYKKGDASGWGSLQLRKKGLRDFGATLSAEAAHHIAVGAETLALRMQKASDSALQLAQQLSVHPKIARVYYPGLEDHPQHARARELFRACGALMSIELRADCDHIAFMNHLKYVISSTHLGDTRTLAIPVASTIYWEMGADKRQAMGIADSLIRISVGIEDADDLLADFDQALAAV